MDNRGTETLCKKTLDFARVIYRLPDDRPATAFNSKRLSPTISRTAYGQLLGKRSRDGFFSIDVCFSVLFPRENPPAPRFELT